MFRRSKRKIVGSIMATLVLLYTVTLSMIVLSEYYDARRQSKEMLEHYVRLYSLDHLPEEEPDLPPFDDFGPPDAEPLFQLASFYSVAYSGQKEVLAFDTGRNGLYSEQQLKGIADEILSLGRSEGTSGTLLYRVIQKDGYTLVAFIDYTVNRESLLSLTRYALIVGGLQLAVLFFVAVFLSHRIIKPLEENDQRQKQFVSDAGHELKTPISVISANAELLSREIRSNEWLDNIRYENERMGELVTQLLDLSRAEGGKAPMEELDLSRLVTGEVLPFESVAFEKGRAIRSKVEEEITLRGNRTQLSQLVSILLDNAIRHSDGDGEIELSLSRQGRYAQLSVSNSGKEIAPEKQKRLFERFYRLDEVRNSDGNHYGLGLAIAKAICEEHNGRISVSCRDGRVIFTVSLPR